MRHGHFFTRSGTDQHDNNHTSAEQSYIPTGRPVAPENVPIVGQTNHISRGGVHSDCHGNLEGRTNKYPSPNVSIGVQPFGPTFSGPDVDPFSHLSITENRSLTPVTPVGQHIHCTNYNAPSMHDVDAGLNCPTGSEGPLKRKRSGISGSCERGSLSSIYSAGSSSSSPQMPMEKPAVDCQSVSSYRGSLTIANEDSPRNVRRRYRIDLEPTRNHPRNHSTPLYQSTAHPSNYAATVQHPNLEANVGQWSRSPHYVASSHRRISPSSADSAVSRHEINRFYVGGSSADVGACHRDPLLSRHPFSSSRNLHGSRAPILREGHVNHSRRVQSSYGHGSRYSHYEHGGTSSTNGIRATPRHCYTGEWRSGYRSGRPRTTVEGRHSVVDVPETHNRNGHETIMMVDRASFYGNSRNFSDQHRDLRLDIDNMSYEELLNLEERIGYVSTGLSEDGMSKCLREKFYHSSDQNHEEVSCPICLEEYRNDDKIGTMERCGHGYHVDCIKKWLVMKKLCPVCKTECSDHEPSHG